MTATTQDRPTQNRLRRLREASGMSAADLAAVLGLTKEELADWEANGIPDSIADDVAGSLAARFRVSTEYLLGKPLEHREWPPLSARTPVTVEIPTDLRDTARFAVNYVLSGVFDEGSDDPDRLDDATTTQLRVAGDVLMQGARARDQLDDGRALTVDGYFLMRLAAAATEYSDSIRVDILEGSGSTDEWMSSLARFDALIAVLRRAIIGATRATEPTGDEA